MFFFLFILIGMYKKRKKWEKVAMKEREEHEFQL